jgi:hypothetical protein
MQNRQLLRPWEPGKRRSDGVRRERDSDLGQLCGRLEQRREDVGSRCGLLDGRGVVGCSVVTHPTQMIPH